MAISDELFIIALGFIINYALVYKKNAFLGNIIFAGLSMAIISFSTDTIFATVGVMLLLISIVSAIYDVVNRKQ